MKFVIFVCFDEEWLKRVIKMKRIGVLTPLDKYNEYTPPECILSPLWNYKIAGKTRKKIGKILI